MVSFNLPLLILFGPLAIALVIFLVPARALRLIETLHVVSLAVVLVASLAIIVEVVAGGAPTAFDDWLRIDSLGAIFVGLIGIAGCLNGLYSLSYIRHDIAEGEFTEAKAKFYYGFFSLFLFTMLLAATANNIVLMWVAIEATTLGSAFLVGSYGKKSSLEAAWST